MTPEQVAAGRAATSATAEAEQPAAGAVRAAALPAKPPAEARKGLDPWLAALAMVGVMVAAGASTGLIRLGRRPGVRHRT